MEAPGGECRNVQTGGGDRVSTISLLGCSTSMALATGPTDEEEVNPVHITRVDKIRVQFANGTSMS